MARGAPSLSHMFFADDGYIYCKDRKEDTDQVLNPLHTFERVSGQQINTDKSSAFFSLNTPEVVKTEIRGLLRFQEANEGTSYLGLPNILGKNKSAVLGYLKSESKTGLKGETRSCFERGKGIAL